MVVRPHVRDEAALNAENVSPPVTATGTALPALDPLPSGPAPQQYADPVIVSPHVCSRPGLTLENVRPPATATGTELGVTDPLPSGPKPP